MLSEKQLPSLEKNGESSDSSPRPNSQNEENYSSSPYFTEKPQSGKKGRQLPAWLDHFNARDMKELIKCSISVWITTVFIFINPVLKVLGQAAFFASLVQFFAPPSGVVFVQVLAMLTVFIGICLGWAWGVITMKAALATRPAADLNARYASLQQSASQNTTYPEQASGTSFTQISIYDGFFLDTRVTVTYFCMICLFIYFMARLRVKVPKLTLTSIFAIIISDTFLTIAPLLPTFNGTLAKTFVIPAAVAVGVGVICNICIFPQSTSHAVLNSMQDVLQPMGGFLDATALYQQDASRHLQLNHLKKVRLQIIDTYKALEASLGFLGIDASVGRWNAEDVSSLREPLRKVLYSFMSLMQFYTAREQGRLKDEDYMKVYEDARKGDQGQEKPQEIGHLQLRKALDFRERMRHPESGQLYHERLRLLSQSNDRFSEICKQCLLAIGESIKHSNERRWFKRPTEAECNEFRNRHTDLLQRLQKERLQFNQNTSDQLWESVTDLFDEKGHFLREHSDTRISAPLVSTIFSLALVKRISNFSEALETLLQRIVSLEEQRTKTRLWLPTSIRKLFGWTMDKDSAVPGTMARTLTSEQRQSTDVKPKAKRGLKARKQKKEEANAKGTAKFQLNEIKHHHQGRQRNKGGQLLLNFVHWLTNTEGLYALRVVVVTVGVGVVAALPSTAGFFYREKGLWAVIMAQVCLVEYTADFIFGFGLRVVGTVAGGIVGMAMWYIGAGNGPGNPYGMAAISAVVIVILMYLRLFAPPVALQGVILSAATAFLVVAYSWVDTHIPSYGNPGVGYTVFWRRLLLVLVGMAAAAVVTLFPRPPSANDHYRKLLSHSLQSVKDRYALFIVNCRENSEPPPDLSEITSKEAIDSAEMIMSIAGPIQLVKFEYSSSPFDAGGLGKICQLCSELNLNVTQLLLYATTLTGHAKTRFILASGALQDELIGEIMAVLTLAQQSLKTGEPLPAILPTPLLARSMDLARVRFQHYKQRQDNHDPTLEMDVMLTREMAMQDGFRQYCEALGAFIEMMSNLDELIMVVKRAVGETCVTDFERDMEA